MKFYLVTNFENDNHRNLRFESKLIAKLRDKISPNYLGRGFRPHLSFLCPPYLSVVEKIKVVP